MAAWLRAHANGKYSSNLQHFHSMQMTLNFGLATLICCTLLGCRTSKPITRETVVGSYIYHSQDPAEKTTDHQWDRLTLYPDGKYDLVKGGPTKPRSEMAGSWILRSRGAEDAEVLLDHSGYPVRIERDEVKLLIDNDVGTWYAKIR